MGLGYSHSNSEDVWVLSEPGKNLSEAIHTEKQELNAEDVVRIAREIAQGMCFLHSKNVAHRWTFYRFNTHLLQLLHRGSYLFRGCLQDTLRGKRNSIED